MNVKFPVGMVSDSVFTFLEGGGAGFPVLRFF